jgi:predicted dehydrogenase
MEKKRYVLVGTGVRAKNFIAPLVQQFKDQTELCAFCDLSPTRMAYYNEQLAGPLGYHAIPTYAADQFEKMIDEKRPHYVIVTTKDSTHHDFIVRALRKGCDVITEKPMTIDAE